MAETTPGPEAGTERVARIRRRLLSWYRRHRRDLPWRQDRDPYRVWVSEIMLQQTRVEAVVPYYVRFLERFPDVHALAEATEEEVLTEWSGLGYYRRARMLHAAAQVIRERHGGRFPAAPERVRELPGVGRYTAGAILSIAFDQPEPVLDGNVTRVLTRLFGWTGDPGRGPLAARLWEAAARLAKGRSPGDLNQALMELGALVCLPAGAARCPDCPLRAECTAHAHDQVAGLPQLPRRRALVAEHWAVGWARRRGRTLLWPRADASLMNGLWELPTVCVRREKAAPPPVLRAALRRTLTTALGAELHVGAELLEHRQAISGRQVFQHVFEVRFDGPTAGTGRWLHDAAVRARPLTTATRRILTRLEPNADPVKRSPARGTRSRSAPSRPRGDCG